MFAIFDDLAGRLIEVWRPKAALRQDHAFSCHCGRSVYFRNSQCLACSMQLGYDPILRDLLSIVPVTAAEAEPGTWRQIDSADPAGKYRRCENLDSPAACNWLVPADDPLRLCRSCRLNRYIPKLDDPDNRRYWLAIETAKRRLIAQLFTLGLPVRSKNDEDPERGMMFDFLRSPPEGPRVMTGHDGGLITLNVEEADDAIREQTRHAMREPYRTLLGHFRHEIGHYYWDRLIAGTKWHEPFREVFGDEREDYAAALERNYTSGPPADWPNRFISAYAAVHPWEDWAESWAHFLHVMNSLSTALAFGLNSGDLETNIEPFALVDLYDPEHPGAKQLLALVNSWVEMITVLNELARSMGQPDFYPFVMSRPVVRKLHFIHLVILDARASAAAE